MRIYLIGLMGSGKTTIGKKLAQRIGYQFVDLDDLIEEKIAMSISDYFAQKGEDGFRLVEQETLRQTFDFENTVISTGGGAPCFFTNIDEINQHGLSCYLKGSAGLLANRLEGATDHRPLLRKITDHDELVAHLDKLINAREPFYTKAKIIVEAKDINADSLLKAIDFK